MKLLPFAHQIFLSVYALYFESRTVRRVVSISYVLEVCVMCIGLGLALPRIQFDSICLVEDLSTGSLLLVVYA